MKKRASSFNLLVVAIAIALAALACAGQAGSDPPEAASTSTPSTAVEGPDRPFLLGFTPFPYDISAEAVNYVYGRLIEDADIIAHHFDNGVPWPEALAGAEFDAHVQDDWAYRRANTPDGHQVYVAITPLSIQRNGVAPYRGERDDMPLPAPWDSYSFDHPDVKTAYLNYALRAIEFFDPDYLAIGIEVNLLMVNRPELWPSYLELHQFVYGELKVRYPDLPVFVSLLGTALLEGYQQEPDHVQQMQALDDILPYTDYFGLSLYPYLTVFLTDELPEDMWDDLFSLSDKPIAITETGYPAEAFKLANDTIEVNGSLEKQAGYIEDLLQEADARQIAFVINFVLRDYDALYELVPEADRDLARVWRDTGLYDGAGNPRPALDIWRAALARPYRPSR